MATAGETYVAHHADEPTARDKHAEAMPPHLVQFVVEGFVILDETKLALALRVLLQGPVGRRG
jgi:hypothetical protein